MNGNKSTGVVATTTPKQHKAKTKQLKSSTKKFKILSEFARGRKLHRFIAEPIGDHCLHSTVSTIESEHSLEFSRERITVPTRFGTTNVTLYWFDADNQAKAQQLVSFLSGL